MTRPAVAALGITTVSLDVQCYISKAVKCEARQNHTEDSKCSVVKQGSLKAVTAIRYAEVAGPKNLCDACKAASQCDNGQSVHTCKNVDSTYVSQFVDFNGADASSLCDEIVKVL